MTRNFDPRYIQAQRLAAQRDARWRAALEREVTAVREAAEREAAQRFSDERQALQAREAQLQRRIAQLEQEVNELQSSADEQKEEYLRLFADLENSRRRLRRTAQQNVERAKESLLRDMIGVVDNLERAVRFAGNDGVEADAALGEGIRATLRQWQQKLALHGVTAIDALGQTFDPTLHEAVGALAMPDQPSDQVVHVEQTGYQLNDRLLRPARVLVSK